MSSLYLREKTTRKSIAIELLKTGSICISFNAKNLNEIHGFCLYSHQQKIVIWKEFGKILFDGLIEEADPTLFEFGDTLINIHYPKDCDISPLTKGRFYLLPGKILNRIFN